MNNTLKNQARNAYEIARLKMASAYGLLVIPLILISCFTCGEIKYPLMIGSILFSSVVLLKWRGLEYGQSVMPGLVAGAASFIVPLVLDYLDICCEGNLQIVLCSISGLLGGLILGRLTMNQGNKNLKKVALAIIIAGLTLTLGCASLGISAVAGLFTALAIGAISYISIKSKA